MRVSGLIDLCVLAAWASPATLQPSALVRDGLSITPGALHPLPRLQRRFLSAIVDWFKRTAQAVNDNIAKAKGYAADSSAGAPSEKKEDLDEAPLYKSQKQDVAIAHRKEDKSGAPSHEKLSTVTLDGSNDEADDEANDDSDDEANDEADDESD